MTRAGERPSWWPRYRVFYPEAIWSKEWIEGFVERMNEDWVMLGEDYMLPPLLIAEDITANWGKPLDADKKED